MRRLKPCHPERSLESTMPSNLFSIGLKRGEALKKAVTLPQFQGALSFIPHLSMPVDDSDAQLCAVLNWAVVSWMREGRVIMTLEDGLLDVLLRSSCSDQLEWLPRLPYDCLYISLEGSGMTVWNKQTGAHKLEGMYLCRDHARTAVSKGEEDCITFIACGEDKGILLGDSILYFFLMAGRPLWFPNNEFYEGSVFDDMRRLVRAVAVLMKMLSAGGDAVERERVPALTEKGQVKKAARKGFSPHAYQVIHLSKQARARRPEHVVVGESHKTYTAWRTIRGHDQLYWYRTPPEDRPVVKTRKDEDGSEWFGCVRYLFPFKSRRGWSEQEGARRVKVKA